MPLLPGYLEGGYEPGRYTVTKSSGEAIDPKAKYLVLRYDRDPHAVIACLTYAVSILPDNPQLHDGIIDAVRAELNLTPASFRGLYGPMLSRLQDVLRPGDHATQAGDLFREAMLNPDDTGHALTGPSPDVDPSGVPFDKGGKPYPSDKSP